MATNSKLRHVLAYVCNIASLALEPAKDLEFYEHWELLTTSDAPVCSVVNSLSVVIVEDIMKFVLCSFVLPV